MKYELGADADMPMDKNEALEKEISSYLSQWDSPQDKKVVEGYKNKKKH
jgi:hypothetical protein